MDNTFRCNLAGAATSLPHFWEHTVGSDHALMALRADWQQQLRRARDELGFRHVRFHGLFDDDVGTVVRNNDVLLYSFFNVDQIMDFLLSIGMKPFVELGFMPEALASGEFRALLTSQLLEVGDERLPAGRREHGVGGKRPLRDVPRVHRAHGFPA